MTTRRFILTSLSIALLAPLSAFAAGDVVGYVEAKEMTNPPPSTALNAFDRFEIAPIAMDAPYAGQPANEEAKKRIQANLDERANRSCRVGTDRSEALYAEDAQDRACNTPHQVRERRCAILGWCVCWWFGGSDDDEAHRRAKRRSDRRTRVLSARQQDGCSVVHGWHGQGHAGAHRHARGRLPQR